MAFVEADPVLEYPPCCVQAQSNGVDVTWHARATAATPVTIQAAGTLPTFPCPTGCAATFSGSGIASGGAWAHSGGDTYTANFTMSSGGVSGSVTYTEPGFPFCPAAGSASGVVTLSGPATGSVQRTSTPTEMGAVTAVTFQLDFTYQRVGATTAVTITSGTATVKFTFSDTPSDYFISNVSGAGLGVLVVNPTGATSACTQGARSLPFTIGGVAALELM